MGSLAPCKHQKLNLKGIDLCGAYSRVSLHLLSSLATEKQEKASFREAQGPTWTPLPRFSQAGRRCLPGTILGASSRLAPG